MLLGLARERDDEGLAAGGDGPQGGLVQREPRALRKSALPVLGRTSLGRPALR